MKRKLSALALLVAGLMLAACSEQTGVPESTAQHGSQSVMETTETHREIPAETASKEEKGVPDSIVKGSDSFADFESYYRVDHCDIAHNVDTVSHTDDVTVTLSQESEYAVTTAVYTLRYQYYKSDDIWELVEESDGSYSTALKAESFITEEGWSGWHANTEYVGYFNNEFYYTIYVKDIDFENSSITMIYDFEFSNDNFDDLVQSTPVTLNLRPFGGTAYIVSIDVEGKNTPYLDGSLSFLLDQNGLSDFN